MSIMRDNLENYDTVEKQVAFAGGAITPLIPADPDRWMFAVSGNGIALSISTLQNLAGGFNLPGIAVAGSETRVISYRDWGPLVNLAWYIQTSAGPSTCTVFTVSEKR